MQLSRTYGFGILTAFVLILLASTIYNLVLNNMVFLVVFVFFLIGCVYALGRVYKEEVHNQSKTQLTWHNHGKEWLAVFLGSVFTYVISVYLELGPVLASGFAGVMAAVFLKQYAVAIFCGSFVGMSSPLLLGLLPFILASILAGLIFVTAKEIFNGYGGKLGTIALSGALITSIALRAPFLDGTAYTALEQWLLVIFSVLGAVFTYSMSIRLKQGPVMASGFIGVLSGGFLPLIFPDFGVTLAVATFGASFVGMSATARFKDEGLIAVSGVLFGLIFIFSAPYFGGAGGKLGTIALTSVLAVKGILMLVEKLPQRDKACN